ncbi:MAG: hypothetical protein K2N26_03050 [Oscillospiraceae bacterium]|nr:hypothetical protein [Oscillospiraceae bacterium]
MENIITSILEIEQNAQKRLEEARQKKDSIIAAAESEKERIIGEKIKEAEEKIRKISLDEKNKTDEKLAEIERSKNDEIKRLDSIYEKRHTEWENDIFNAVITML